MKPWPIAALVAASVMGGAVLAEPNPVLNPAPSAQAWADIAKLPDLSGVWLPKPLAPVNGIYVPADNLPVFTPKAQARIDRMLAEDKAGKPENIFVDCLPEGMPGFVLMTLNAAEFLVTPGRVTVLGEFDGNRLRRIWTDGRGHPDDPDLTFNGHSIGHWEGQTLVVDTVGILPQVYIPLGQSVGVPNNGDMHVVERIHLTAPDILVDDMTIFAPKVLAKPWVYSRAFTRKRDRAFDVVEASCRQGDFTQDTDADGFAVFRPLTRTQGGAPVPGKP
jgi:hypothetical protein